MFDQIISSIPLIVWPPIASPIAAQLISQLSHFNSTERLHPQELQEFQFQQLFVLYNFARSKVPFYQERLALFSILNQQELKKQWANIPILSRTMLYEHADQLFSDVPEHGASDLVKTGGSTGTKVSVKANMTTQFFWLALLLRTHLWHADNFNNSWASISFTSDPNAKPPYGAKYNHWNSAFSQLVKTGPGYQLSMCSAQEEADWLLRVNPDYLNCNPTVLSEIVKCFRGMDHIPTNLKKIYTTSELLRPETRMLVNEVLNIPIVDIYSAAEVGYIAIQCPRDENVYHVQSESLYVEILNEDGLPCEVGETGRVIVTTLHNFSSPLIRYDIGDYATVGATCQCGRTLPVLKQIMGRTRNMMHLADGRKIWPSFRINGVSLYDLFPGAQLQLVQKSLTEIQINLGQFPPLTQVQENEMRQKLRFFYPTPFDFSFNYVSQIPRSKSGKYEDFKNELELVV